MKARNAIAPIVERHRVQLVLSGHDHDYERSIPWRQYVTTGGLVTYVVTGGGGAALYPVGAGAWTAKSASYHHYVRVTAGDCVMTIQGVRIDGVVFDQSSIDRCATANQEPQLSTTGTMARGSHTAAATAAPSAVARAGTRRE